MIEVFLIFLPAYVANSFPVILGGSVPIDELIGARVFGKHKTLLGFVSGISAGIITAYLISPYTPLPFREAFMLGIITAIGAIVGDLVGSYIKRRYGMKEGSEFLLDHIFFIVVAVSFVLAVNREVINLVDALLFIALTFFIHKGANIVAHRTGLKSVPW
ncbi:MAG: CDP-archaeol synthase [Methanobacteriota archaeon]|nr:MAG: CDP-archaeol synthase [Euryarchaeota archaeon]